jgi:cytochrome c5
VKKRNALLLIVLVAVVAASPFLKRQLDRIRVDLPTYERPKNLVHAEKQNWTEEQRNRFHHTPQGTRLLPISWFMALEQPCLSPFGCGKFSDPAYMSRFGFIPSDAGTDINPYGLPVGFAVSKDATDPNGEPVVGLTCAACHTGELHYGNYAVQIEGAPAMIEVAAFQRALGLALGFNTKLPFRLGRYGRFEKEVLAKNPGLDPAALKKQVYDLVALGEETVKITEERHIYDHGAGFARTDALARIGNQVFAADMGNVDNYAPANAPVRFPQIWHASWFNWVQYNSSIANPLARNIGEALGVRAVAKLSGPDATKFENSVDIRGLRWMEDTLAGKEPFEGLKAPTWPKEFPALDQAKVAAGAGLYKTYCQECHLAPLPDLIEEYKKASTDAAYETQNWWRGSNGRLFLKVKDLPLSVVGTDENEAKDFMDRKANASTLGVREISASEGLDLVTTKIAERFFTLENIPETPESEREAWSGGRSAKDPKIRAKLIYKARPLNGIWAAAPYLHNGSVLTLDALLSPDDKARPDDFWLGSKQFDPVKVGYAGTKIDGATHYLTSQPGNKNIGHRFKNDKGPGVIGPALSADERAQIIEYLKSL